MERRDILNILMNAKESYTKHSREGSFCNCGMCFHIKQELYRFEAGPMPYEDIPNYIPEFTPVNAGVVEVKQEDYWWDCRQVTPRIEFFDMLIKLYTDDIKKQKAYIVEEANDIILDKYSNMLQLK